MVVFASPNPNTIIPAVIARTTATIHAPRAMSVSAWATTTPFVTMVVPKPAIVVMATIVLSLRQVNVAVYHRALSRAARMVISAMR